MPEDLTREGVGDIGARAERVAFADLRPDSMLPVMGAGDLPLRRSDGAGRGLARDLKRLGKKTARLAPGLSAALDVERAYGHVFLFVPVAIGLGSAVWFLLPQQTSAWSCALALPAFAVTGLMARGGSARAVLLMLCLILTGMLLANFEAWRRAAVILDSPVTTTVTGVVERGEMVGPGMRYLVSITGTSEPSLRRPPLRVTLVARGRHVPFENGAAITGRARLSPPSGPALPGLNDFAFSAYFDGIGAVGHFYGAPKAATASEKRAGPTEQVERWLFALRRQIGDRIRSIAPGDAGAFAAAIITDERRAISNDTVEALRVSGLAHIVAISGLNMALAAGIFFVGLRTLLALSPAAAQALPVKKIAAAGALAMVTGYYLISGFGVSAQRAYIMMAVILMAVLLDRPSISLRNVALSALIIIVWTPSEILGPSFQMSFAATAALVAGYAAWARRGQERPHEPLPFRHPMVMSIVRIWNFVAGIILTSLIGSLATAMFSVEHFHRIATYGLAANLAAMPIISFLVMPAGLAAMLLMPFGLDAPFITIMAESLDWVIAIARHVASWGGDVVIGQQHPWFLPLGVIGFLLLTLLRSRLRLAGLPFLAAAIILFSSHTLPASDLLISEDGTLAAMKTGEGIAIKRTRPPAFIYDQWRRARRLPDAQAPVIQKDEASTPQPPARGEPLSASAIADARRGMREVGDGKFTCRERAWCTAMSPAGVIVVVVEDGRYTGAACDVADLVIAPRARFDTCRSGKPLLNVATLRKTGALEIDFAGSRVHADWQIATAMTGSSRPWSIHRQYDWRRDAYDPSLPDWLTRVTGSAIATTSDSAAKTPGSSLIDAASEIRAPDVASDFELSDSGG
ncbi:ComEC/Rec2 family competence protein [Rhizobium sp. NFR07]|uniref:ComEC/Rec2 family competence protein n=1 Tax=Rhizobium sp. NFR07 TaxID=1566262 RepID=UPI000B87ECA4|nr:ComEC/Rec2 family competence protein [Rhizobium sp. NFR07]